MLGLFPTIVALTAATLPARHVIDGQDLSKALLQSDSLPPRLLFHYFGSQLQAVRDGKWKLVVPIDHLPERRLASLWLTHQPDLVARQHRLWPQPTLYDLSQDLGETTDVAAQYPEVVARLLARARSFDTTFESHKTSIRNHRRAKPRRHLA